MPVTFPLEARAVTKRYGSPLTRRTTALDEVTLAIPEGSITALVGPNGAGKSTLIRGWIGFERPTRGVLLVGGTDPQRRRGAAVGHVGYVPQAASLYRSLTVAEHLDMAGSLRHGFDRPAAAARLRELDVPLDRPAGQLSGGQQAQVGLAIALGTRAEVLLLDEPLASLDPLARREFLRVLVDAVRRDGSTALLASHVITDVEAACDRLVVLGAGRALLHDSLAAAVADHRVAASEQLPGRVVAEFPGPAGEPLTLWRASAGGRPAALDEVVLGYLAAGRRAGAAGTPVSERAN